ncbi:MAG TPA: prepilin peptidase [Clostridia bacterium]|nr:prepilin peptidase [Clostridia bacterium]
MQNILILIEYFFVFTAGLALGSFLNVCIYRIPVHESIVTGRSHCTSCGNAIKDYDLIPVVSFILLRGRCRSCGAKISWRYPLVEMLNAVAYVLIFTFSGATALSFVYAAAVSAYIVIAFIDFDKSIIPDSIVLYIIIIGVIALIISHNIPAYERIIGFFSISVPLLAAAILSKGGMGMGDVKYAAAAGLVLGYKLALLGLFLGSVAGALFGVVYAVKSKKSLKTSIPFGPFLSLGFGLSMLFGNVILNFYFSLFRPC